MRALHRVREGIERADDVIAVEAEVKREVVPRSRRHHHVRDPVAAGNGGDQRLGAVTSRHADHIGAAGDRILGKLEHVIAGAKHHGLDAASRAFAGQIELHRLSATGLRVHQQHRMQRGRHRAARSGCGLKLIDAGVERRPGRSDRQHAERRRTERSPPHDIRDPDRRQQQGQPAGRDQEGDGAAGAPARHRRPAPANHNDGSQQCDHQSPAIVERRHDHHQHRRCRRKQRDGSHDPVASAGSGAQNGSGIHRNGRLGSAYPPGRCRGGSLTSLVVSGP